MVGRFVDALWGLFGESDSALIIVISIGFIVWRAVPWYLKKRSGELEEEQKAKKDSREILVNLEIQNNSIVEKQEQQQTAFTFVTEELVKTNNYLQEVNGNFGRHIGDSNIHTSVDKLITGKMCGMVSGAIKEKIEESAQRQEESTQRQESVIERIFEKIDNIKDDIKEVAVSAATSCEVSPKKHKSRRKLGGKKEVES